MMSLRLYSRLNVKVRTALLWAITQRVVILPYRRFGITYCFHLEGSKWVLDTCRWDPIGGPETSVRNDHYSLHNSSEERSFHLPLGGSLKSRKCDAVLPIFFSLLHLIFFLFLLYSSRSTPLPPVPTLSRFRPSALLPVRMNSTNLRLQKSVRTSRNTPFSSRQHNTLQHGYTNITPHFCSCILVLLRS
jgi:hypothetical protein